MSTIIRVAMTQTKNAYADMPASVDQLDTLADRLDAVRDANVDHHEALIRGAAAAGAKLVGLGELFAGPYFGLEKRDLWRGLAESAVDGPSVSRMRKLAAALGVVIIAPIYEVAADGRFNTAVVIDADGTVRGRYRKSHIPDGANEQGSFHEPFYYGRSNCEPYFPVFDTAVGKVGVAICYDRHFEGVMSSLAAGGAQIVLSPAVTFGSKSRRMWQIEFEVDASRHNMFIGGSNRMGTEPPWTIDYFGDSHWVGPHGRSEDISADGELVIADLDLGQLDNDPSGWDLPRDRRLDIYRYG